MDVVGATVVVPVVELFPGVVIVVVVDGVVDVGVVVFVVDSPVGSVESGVPVDSVLAEAFTDRISPEERKLKHEVSVKMMNFVS